MQVAAITEPLATSAGLTQANRALRAYLQENYPAMKPSTNTRSMKVQRDKSRTKQAKTATIARKRARKVKASRYV